MQARLGREHRLRIATGAEGAVDGERRSRQRQGLHHLGEQDWYVRSTIGGAWKAVAGPLHRIAVGMGTTSGMVARLLNPGRPERPQPGGRMKDRSSGEAKAEGPYPALAGCVRRSEMRRWQDGGGYHGPLNIVNAPAATARPRRDQTSARLTERKLWARNAHVHDGRIHAVRKGGRPETDRGPRRRAGRNAGYWA